MLGLLHFSLFFSLSAVDITSVTSLSLIRKRLRASSDPAKQRLRDEAKRVHVSLASKKRKTSENLSSQTRPLHRKKTIEARSHRLENFPITACDTPPRRLGLEALTLLALLLLRQQQQQSLLRAPLPRDRKKKSHCHQRPPISHQLFFTHFRKQALRLPFSCSPDPPRHERYDGHGYSNRGDAKGEGNRAGIAY